MRVPARRKMTARRRWWLPYAVLTVVAAVVAGLIALGQGSPERVMDLNNSGVWVSNDQRGLFGRVNRSAGALDAAVADPAQNPGAVMVDVLQDQETVLGWTRSQSRLFAIDTRTSVASGAPVMVGSLSAVAMGGGVIAVVNAETGEVRTTSYSPGSPAVLEGLAATAPALATLPVVGDLAQPVAVAVDGAGRVFAVSASGDWVLASGGAPVYGNVGRSLGAVTASLVGGVGVVADHLSGDVFLSNGQQVSLGAGSEVALQQPSVSGDRVVVETTTGLFSFLLTGGAPVSLFDLAANPVEGSSTVVGATAQPVVLGGSVYGVWGGAPGRVVRLDLSGVENVRFPVDGSLLDRPVFRVNRGSVVVNDMTTGSVFDLEDQQLSDSWDSVDPQDVADTGDTESDDKAAPQASPDQLWARPGRLAVLHVLDNDSNPGTGLVAITGVSGPDAAAAAISPNGQTLVVTVPADQTSDMNLTYTITNRSVTATTGSADPAEASSSAAVVVSMRQPGENNHPELRGTLGTDPAKPDFTVASGGTLSLAPAAQWRDADSDPVLVLQAAAGNRSWAVTAEGLILYSAPTTAYELIDEVTYQVSDGLGTPVMGTIRVRVLAANANEGVAPLAMSDVVRGVVGQPISFYPLDNDRPGCDPMDSHAQLVLATPVIAPAGLTATTDLLSGAVTVTASQVDSYFLDYTVSFGAQFASGKIRLDIVDADTIMAMPDPVVVRGTVPVMVDVLANDHDSQGAMLSVTSAVAREPDRVQVVVAQGRWLRVAVVNPVITPAPTVVDYVVVNGRGDQAMGQVIVSQAPAVSVDKVSVVDDYARVRVGDVTAVWVLANDAAESGRPLVINDNVPGLPAGQLRVEDPSAKINQATVNVGQAFVDGDRVRYIAPTSGEARRLRIEYQAGVAMGSPVTGYIWVDVVPVPVDDETTGATRTQANHAPEPVLVEVRAMVGDTVVVPVETYGQDPDGDSVTVTGLAVPPKFGRVVEVTADALTYESYPDVDDPGVDSLQFYVQDRFGAVGVGTARIGLLPAGAPALPLAVDDVVTAQPDSPVTVLPLTNDIIPIGNSNLALAFDLERDGVSLDQQGRAVLTNAPALDQPAVSVNYHVLSGGRAGVSAQLTVRSQEGYLNPPRVFDHAADQVDQGMASAEVLEAAWDIDGPASALHIVAVGAPGVFDGGLVSVPMSDRGQVIPYVVEDGDGSQAMAVVFVPALSSGRPTLNSGGLILMDQNGTKQVDLNDYITSPRGSDVHLTLASKVWTSPATAIVPTVDSDQRVTLTAGNDYVGPGALTVEVRDAPDATDPNALIGVVTIPVQIGPVIPMLWCPTTTLSVVQGGVALPVDVAGICRVWAPTPGGASALRFTAEWASGGQEISVSGRDGGRLPSDWLTLQAGPTSLPGSQSVLTIRVDGYDATAQLLVEVIPVPRPTIAVSDIVGVKQGTTVEAPVRVSSQMLSAVQNIIQVTQTGGPATTVTWDDTRVQVTAAADAHGVATFSVLAADVVVDDRADRQVTGGFSVTIFGVPDAPSPPQPATQLRSQSAVVSFTPGADNGAPITSYEVRWESGGQSGSQSCGLSTTCEIPGLVNGQEYRFQVRAINQAGPSPWSDFGPMVVPNAIPGAVTGFEVSSIGCNQLDLVWTGADGDGTPPTGYRLSWQGLANPITVTGLTHTPNGLDNNTLYTFTIEAVNTAGVGRPITIQGQPSCKPVWSQGELTVAPQDLGATAQVVVSWPVADPQGPGPVTYQVTRTSSGDTKVFPPTQRTSLDDAGVRYDGTTYTYSVTATNATGGPEHTTDGPSTTWKAVNAPMPWSGVSAVSLEATGVNGQVRVTVNDFPNYRDSSGTVTATVGTQQVTLTASNPSALINGLTNGQDLTASFIACNVSGSCNTTQSAQALKGGPFGPLAQPSITAQAGSGQQVCFTASANGNGRTATLTVTPSVGQSFTVSGTGPMELKDRCVSAGAWDKEVTFTAQLTTSATTPARSNPPEAKTSARSAMTKPDDFGANDLRLEPTGKNGELELTVLKTPTSNGDNGALTIHWSANGNTGVVTGGKAIIPNLTNGQLTTVEVWASNSQGDNTHVQRQATPYGPLATPTLESAPPQGTKACFKVLASDTNGESAQLIVTDAQSGAVLHTVPATNGTISTDFCHDTGGYDQEVRATARLVPGVDTQKRVDSNPTQPVSSFSATQAPNPLYSSDVSLTATGTSGQAELAVTNWPASNSTRTTEYLEVTYNGQTQTLPRNQVPVKLNGLTDGQETVVTIKVCNGLNGTMLACNDALPVKVITYGPVLSTPTITSTAGQPTQACVQVAYNTTGVEAQLVTWVDGQEEQSQKVTGSGTISRCKDTGGYDRSANYTAQLKPMSGQNRQASAVTAFNAKSSNPARINSFTAGSRTLSPSYDKMLCVDFTYAPHDNYVKVIVTIGSGTWTYDGSSGKSQECWDPGTASTQYTASIKIVDANNTGKVLAGPVERYPTTPANPTPSVSFQFGSDITYHSSCSGCRNLLITLSNFPGEVTCKLYDYQNTHSATFWGGNGVYDTMNSNYPAYTGRHYGSGPLRLQCEGYESFTTTMPSPR